MNHGPWLAALLCAGAQAQPSSTYLSAQDLYNRLSGTGSQLAMAYGYVAGVADTKGGATICIPPGIVTLGQMADMVKQTLERVPSERHLPADVYVEATLSGRWPCAKKGNGI